MNILIPLGGNYDPLQNILGKPMIFWLLDNINLLKVNLLILIYNNNVINFETIIKTRYNYVKILFYELKTATRNVIETVNYLLEYLTINKYDDFPILSLDGDNIYLNNFIDDWKKNNCIYTFIDKNNNYFDSVDNGIKNSYIIVDKNNKITQIIEQQKISENACTGVYGFNSWKELYNTTKTFNNFENSICYFSNIIDKQIKNKTIYENITIGNNDYIQLGSSTRIRFFTDNILTKYNNIYTPPKIMIHFENILIMNNNKEYILNMVNINYIKLLKTFKCYIIISTHYKSTSKNINYIVNLLTKHEIIYDEIKFDIPNFDFYINDKTITSNNMEYKLGFYKNSIDARTFNNIKTANMEIIIKTSNNLKAQINYYKNIPENIKHLFPCFIDCDSNYKSYRMEKVQGIPIINLYLNMKLDEQLLLFIINNFKKIHNEDVYDNDDINIYSNYKIKLDKRYETNKEIYKKYNNSTEFYNNLSEKLLEYENNNIGIKTIIHGDPVLTNILLTNNSEIKFIDMRGELGDKLSIYGDKLYDWAKLYQSLIGYDEIHEEKILDNDYKNNIINIFEKEYKNEFINDIKLKNLKLITSSLLFTLIPLHDNPVKCEKYYNLGFKLFFA